MTLAQIAEKPITVATEDAISNFVDSRQGRYAEPFLAVSVLRLNRIVRSQAPSMRQETLQQA
jgi:hypothetical protein